MCRATQIYECQFYLIPIFCVILTKHLAFCGYSRTNITNYFIETKPYHSCTVHLKAFSNKPAELETFQRIVDANQDEHVLWTLWNHNASTFVDPSIHFYEICSVNVVLDYLPVDTEELIVEYIQIKNEYA
jgi:hypothetical protein